MSDGSSQLSFESCSKIGNRSPHECSPVDIHSLSFFDTGDSNSSNNGDEHGVGEDGFDVHGWEEEANDGGEDRLAGLDDLSKTDGTNSHLFIVASEAYVMAINVRICHSALSQQGTQHFEVDPKTLCSNTVTTLLTAKTDPA